MRNIILFDDENWERLLPLTFAKPVAELRIGIWTIAEKWQFMLGGRVSYITQEHLTEKFPINIQDDNLLINGAVLPTRELANLIIHLDVNEALMNEDELIAARFPRAQFEAMQRDEPIQELQGYPLKDISFVSIEYPWHLFQYSEKAIAADFKLVTEGRESDPIHPSNQVLGPENVFIEEGAQVQCATINAELGPVYIGRGATVMEGCMIRGPFVLGDYGVLKMGTKIYGPTSLGPFCTGGGEIKNSVIQSHTNKAHDGYIGNSVIGSFCNLGAGTGCSNLKNTLSEVRVWSYQANSYIPTNTSFCGIFMGDHVKTGVNTQFNSGTIIGFSCNIMGEQTSRKFMPSYTWGTGQTYQTFQLVKAIEVAKRTTQQKHSHLDHKDEEIMKKIFHLTEKYRSGYQ